MRGVCLAVLALAWSGVIFGATYLGGSGSLPRKYVIPMPFLMFGSLAYLFAAHGDSFTMTTWSDWVGSGLKGMSEMGKSLGRLPAWAVVLLVACITSTVIVLATIPSRPEGYAVQEKQGYWLEDAHGGKICPLTEKEFRNFGAEIESDRPLAAICFDLSLVATIGFAFGPGSPRKIRATKL